jgi:hypothetical protein
MVQPRKQHPPRGVGPFFCIGLAVMLCSSAAVAQSLTDTTNSTLTVVLPWTLTPGSSTTPASTSAPFRLRSNNPTASGGYRVDATATFSVTDSTAAAGGADIAATDIGVGITSIATAPNDDMPRADVIAAGFNYNPATVVGTNGYTPYTGIGSGQATIGDLSTSRKILNGNRISNSAGTGNPNNWLTVTMTFGAVPQFFTPCTFSSVITLTISNGP